MFCLPSMSLLRTAPRRRNCDVGKQALTRTLSKGHCPFLRNQDHKFHTFTISNTRMHSAQKPTLVIVHGGWHDPSCFDFVRKPLEDDGYTCHVPALPSVGELSAFKTSSDDVNIVHSIVKDCLAHGENVIVVGHSNGGLKANGALKGLVGQESSTCQDQGRVLGLGIIAGLIPPVRPTAPKNAPAGSEEPPQHLDQNRWKPSVSPSHLN